MNIELEELTEERRYWSTGTEISEALAGSERDYRRLQTVLLIEDSKELNEALARRLEHAGLNAVSAYDGLSGLEKIQFEDPDLVILDLGLPRLSGFKLLHRLRSLPTIGDAPIIIVTGDPDPSIEARAAAYGVARVLRKPVRQRQIVQAVREVLDGFG